MASAATWMDPETVLLSEVKERKINIISQHLYMKSKKKMVQMNLFTKQNHRCRKQTYDYQGAKGREG